MSVHDLLPGLASLASSVSALLSLADYSSPIYMSTNAASEAQIITNQQTHSTRKQELQSHCF